MARMIPKFLSPEIKSNAERKIFALFQNAPDTDDWIVLHSLGIANHRNLIYGEVDFLVLAPGIPTIWGNLYALWQGAWENSPDRVGAWSEIFSAFIP